MGIHICELFCFYFKLLVECFSLDGLDLLNFFATGSSLERRKVFYLQKSLGIFRKEKNETVFPDSRHLSPLHILKYIIKTTFANRMGYRMICSQSNCKSIFRIEDKIILYRKDSIGSYKLRENKNLFPVF